jgi:hypothetical protein
MYQLFFYGLNSHQQTKLLKTPGWKDQVYVSFTVWKYATGYHPDGSDVLAQDYSTSFKEYKTTCTDRCLMAPYLEFFNSGIDLTGVRLISPTCNPKYVYDFKYFFPFWKKQLTNDADELKTDGTGLWNKKDKTDKPKVDKAIEQL